MNNVKQYILDRLKEPSTWRGFVLLVTALGVKLSPEQMGIIVQVGLGLAGFVAVITQG